MTNGLLPEQIHRVVDAALAEDVAAGDLTTRLVVDESATGHARAVAREALVAAGLGVFRAVFLRVDPRIEILLAAADGSRVKSGDVLASLRGPMRGILTAERTALNLLGRMCGIATLTRRHVDALPSGSRTRILDTRKTTVGLRALERYAVRCGGGLNHRSDLAGGILVKDNHIAACGGFVADAVRRALAGAGPTQRVEVEVETAEQLDEAIAAGAEAILIDNASLDLARAAVERCSGRILIEVSGGVRVEDVPAIAAIGVDFISVGALTHSAPWADIALEVEPFPGDPRSATASPGR